MRIRPQSLSDYIKQFTQEASYKLSPFVVSGKLNIEFIKGNQNKRINTRRLELEDKPNPSGVYTEKKVFNRMLPIYLTRYGILTKNMPIPGFKPQDNSAKRQFDSVRGNDFINNFIADIGFKRMYNKLIILSDSYGLGWIKTGIDWSQGDEIAKTNVNTETDENHKRTGTYTIREGRPFIEVVPLYEVFPDNLHADSMEEINELVHRRAFSCSYILRKWGIEVEPEKIDAISMAQSPRYTDLAFKIQDNADYAYVYEYYKKPDAEYPNGRYVLMIRDKIIHDGVLPYVNSNNQRKIPFDFVNLQNIPNYLVGVTVYSQIIPIQETYNAMKNRFLEYMNHLAIGQMFYYEGSLVNPKTFTTKPGKLIALKRNSKPPQPVQKAQLSNEFNGYLRSLEEDMLITAGLSQLTAFGAAKSSIRTDGVVDKVDESDQNKLANAVENLSSAVLEAFKKVMYCEVERARILKEQLKLAKKDDYAVRYKLDNVDIEQMSIVNRDFLIQDDQVVDKKIQQASSLGLYNPEANLSYISKLHLMDALKANYLIDTLDPNEKAQHDLIEAEHFDITEKNQIPQAESFHLHAQHLIEHNIFRVSPEIRILKEKEPDRYKVIMEALNAHIEQHEKFDKQSKQPNPIENAKAFFGGTAR